MFPATTLAARRCVERYHRLVEYSPDQPRDERGRWTAAADAGRGIQDAGFYNGRPHWREFDTHERAWSAGRDAAQMMSAQPQAARTAMQAAEAGMRAASTRATDAELANRLQFYRREADRYRSAPTIYGWGHHAAASDHAASIIAGEMERRTPGSVSQVENRNAAALRYEQATSFKRMTSQPQR